MPRRKSPSHASRAIEVPGGTERSRPSRATAMMRYAVQRAVCIGCSAGCS
jgi:hypothetical protein